MPHRVAQIDLVDIPTMVGEIVGDEGVKVIIHQGVVVAHEGGVIVEVDLFAAMICIVSHELVEQGGQLLLILDKDALEQACLSTQVVLANGYPVDEGVGIEGDTERSVWVNVSIHA